MALVKPALPNVSPGQPITAQGWNAILSAVNELFDGVNAFGTDALAVTLTAGGSALTSAVVVAVPATGQPVVAVPPHGTTTAFTLTNLTPGNWTIHVAAPGLAIPPGQEVTIPRGPLVISLASNTVSMPQLFGLNYSIAHGTLGSQAIAIELVLDVDGIEISKTAPPTDHAGARVLFQFPAAGTRVVPTAAATRLVISSAQTKAKDTKEFKEFEKKDFVDKVVKEFDIEEKAVKEVEKDLEKTPDNKLIIDKASDVVGKAGDTVLPAGGGPGPQPRSARGEGDERVFIPPDERPVVGEDAIKQPRNE